MIELTEELQREGFLKTLFESIPCGVLVLNPERRVMAANNVIERAFGISADSIIKKVGGEALRCVYAFDDPRGCGYSSACRSCMVKQTAEAAFTGRITRRRRVEVEWKTPSGAVNHTMLITASPLRFKDEEFAVVMIEDITELSRLRMRLQAENSFAGIIGVDPKMQELFETIRDLADASAAVLIQGESGTGKELVAAAIHNEGCRADKLFVPVNCSALPDGLLESELFGHVKGAFTGAIRDKKGRFELADGGTIFLDEVGDLPQSLQSKLLRVLQEGTFTRVGGEKQTSIDARVVCATHRDLRQDVADGKFREDLFYRVAVVPITVPPLRERVNDIPLIADHIAREASRESGRNVELSPDTISLMMDYRWPGNVRELQNAVQYAAVKSRGDVIMPEHLPPNILSALKAGGNVSAVKPSANSTNSRRKLNEESVRQALEETDGNKQAAARLLGVGRATLYRFLDDNPIG